MHLLNRSVVSHALLNTELHPNTNIYRTLFNRFISGKLVWRGQKSQHDFTMKAQPFNRRLMFQNSSICPRWGQRSSAFWGVWADRVVRKLLVLGFLWLNASLCGLFENIPSEILSRHHSFSPEMLPHVSRHRDTPAVNSGMTSASFPPDPTDLRVYKGGTFTPAHADSCSHEMMLISWGLHRNRNRSK